MSVETREKAKFKYRNCKRLVRVSQWQIPHVREAISGTKGSLLSVKKRR